MNGTRRSALGNGALVRLAIANLLATIAQWALFIGALVYAFDHGGAHTAGLASVCLLVPTAIVAPAAGAAAQRWHPYQVRLVAFAVQTLAFAGGAIAGFAEAPVLVVIGCCTIAAAGFTFLNPACAVLLPGIVRSARELTVANVWVSSCDSVSMLGGSLVATALLGLQGPALVLAGCAALAGVSTITTLSNSRAESPLTRYNDAVEPTGAVRLVLNSIKGLRERPGVASVLAITASQYLLVGSFDLIVVVLASQALALGTSGPGLLAASVGVGALISALVSTYLVRRDRLSTLLIAAVAGVAAASALLGSEPTLTLALVLLPVAGFSGSLLNLTGRMMLQRATPPHATAGIFAAIELFSGIGMVVGSIGTQILIAVGSVETALIGLGIYFAILLVFNWRSLRIADKSADIPVVAISLLRRIPAFSPLPPIALEAVARMATEVTVAAGEVVMTEGEQGDHYYAVADGSFDIVSGGTYIKTAERGAGFGEIALLANVPRTATITASRPGSLLAIHRVPFLIAVTGSDSSHQAALAEIRAMGLDIERDGSE